jgi:hypothetical protein
MEDKAVDGKTPIAVQARRLYSQVQSPIQDLDESTLQNIWDMPAPVRLQPRLVSVEEENSEIIEVMEDLGEWNYNTLTLNSASKRNPLREMGLYVFSTLGLVNRFKISHNELNAFL